MASKSTTNNKKKKNKNSNRQRNLIYLTTSSSTSFRSSIEVNRPEFFKSLKMSYNFSTPREKSARQRTTFLLLSFSICALCVLCG
jgi:hypothetical protein